MPVVVANIEARTTSISIQGAVVASHLCRVCVLPQGAIASNLRCRGMVMFAVSSWSRIAVRGSYR